MSYIEELVGLLGSERVTTNPTVLEHHSHDESYHAPRLPEVVVFPQDAEEVSQIMKLANEKKIAVTPFGLGTSLEGHVIPYNGGISMDFSLMNQVLEVRPQDFLVRVQPGVTRTQLNKELKKHGLFFSVDPGADATVGGMAATNASGTTSVRYGVMRDNVRDLEVVLADGRIIHTGSMVAKSSSGYHLTGLFVGSEGTLGAFTELTLRVYGIPEATMAARASFPTVQDAVNTVVDILSAGIPVARIELVDERSIRQVNLFKETDYPESPTLFIEFHGSEQSLQHDIEFAQGIAGEHGCTQFLFETDSKARAQLWDARHNLAYAFVHKSPGKKMMVTDVCVPFSELAGAVVDARESIDRSGLDGAVLGHVGDGNYHVILMIDLDDKEEVARADKLNAHLVEYALQRGGTCTGEHGVGVGKAKYQRAEHGESLDVMKSFKQVLDPNGILNPGKIFE
ncbi:MULTISPECIES: FAD-linked oxidase C-terminal domain-containing protein [Brevibacillus]|uniref:D-lactate dehydrogenase (cytochrome) n=1 Tax=Brevibacillus invocatus TaxID=173959 RepID=A0A3M8CJX1_9BACL|nr:MULTISPECIES: FAD-linked oxidase C-terminal domain-containing protein [Brevibacillus]MCM3077641.1 FAD-binding protein [Brevibacillus invocatus]MCM3428643.1 FAD-binding protein [Brevibacillus invocatus]MDH4617468.1 FAD-binding protein [Brevibacillus sp. AY1]RNB75878.1 FAD-binding protein [Brevibacillus invocatus]